MENQELQNWLITAIQTVACGIATRLEKQNVVIYKCGTVLRIDMKDMFDK